MITPDNILYEGKDYILGRHLGKNGYPIIGTDVRKTFRLVQILTECFKILGRPQTILCEGRLSENQLEEIHEVFPSAYRVFMESGDLFILDYKYDPTYE